MEFDEPKLITEGMKQGLARMYADTYMRDYLMHAISIAKSNAITLMEKGNFTEAQAYAARAKSLTQLLAKGKNFFTYFQANKKGLVELTNVTEVKL